VRLYRVEGAAADIPEGDGDAGGMTGAIHEFCWMAAVSASLFVLDTLCCVAGALWAGTV
jgi:hypothetical protein